MVGTRLLLKQFFLSWEKQMRMVERHIRKVEFHISKVGGLGIMGCYGEGIGGVNGSNVSQGVMWGSLMSWGEPWSVLGKMRVSLGTMVCHWAPCRCHWAPYGCHWVSLGVTGHHAGVTGHHGVSLGTM